MTQAYEQLLGIIEKYFDQSVLVFWGKVNEVSFSSEQNGEMSPALSTNGSNFPLTSSLFLFFAYVTSEIRLFGDK